MLRQASVPTTVPIKPSNPATKQQQVHHDGVDNIAFTLTQSAHGFRSGNAQKFYHCQLQGQKAKSNRETQQ